MIVDSWGAKSIYFSENVFEKKIMIQRDSEKITQILNGGVINAKDLQVYLWNGREEVIINDFSQQTYKHYMLAAVNYYYTEKIQYPNWHLIEEQQIINGLQCQKATCYFGGRNYTAWFTNEIPISTGPWKLHGLPGAIVRVYDSQEYFTYELIKNELFEISEEKIQSYHILFRGINEKNVSKKFFFELLKEEFEDISAFNRRHGLGIEKSANTINKPKYYNPQEFE